MLFRSPFLLSGGGGMQIGSVVEDHYLRGTAAVAGSAGSTHIQHTLNEIEPKVYIIQQNCLVLSK